MLERYNAALIVTGVVAAVGICSGTSPTSFPSLQYLLGTKGSVLSECSEDTLGSIIVAVLLAEGAFNFIQGLIAVLAGTPLKRKGISQIEPLSILIQCCLYQ